MSRKRKCDHEYELIEERPSHTCSEYQDGVTISYHDFIYMCKKCHHCKIEVKMVPILPYQPKPVNNKIIEVCEYNIKL